VKRTLSTSSTALVLSLAALTAANATALNTVPLNAQGKPVAYGGINTTINSSIKPYVPPTIKPMTLNTVPLNTQGKPVSTTPVAYGGVNTTINSSVNPYVVPSSKPGTLNTVPLNAQGKPVSSTPVAYGLTNTTIGSSLNVPKTVVTTAAGLLQNTGNFATPNVKATIATGPIPTPKPGSTTPIYNQNPTDSSEPDSLASITDLVQTPTSINPARLEVTNDSVSSINTTQSINPAQLKTTSTYTVNNLTALQTTPTSVNPAELKTTPTSINPAELKITPTSVNPAELKTTPANSPKTLNSQTAGSLTLGSARPSSEIVANGGATNSDAGAMAAAGAALGTVSNVPPAHNLDVDDQLSAAFSAAGQAVQNKGVVVGVPGVNGTPYVIPNSSSNAGQPAIGSQAGINLANAFNGGAGSSGASAASGGAGAGAATGANTGGAQSAGPIATNGTFGDFLGSSSQQSNVPSGAFQTTANQNKAAAAQTAVSLLNSGDISVASLHQYNNPPVSQNNATSTSSANANAGGNSNGVVGAINNVVNQAATNLNNQLNSMVPANDTSVGAQLTRSVLTFGQPKPGDSLTSMGMVPILVPVIGEAGPAVQAVEGLEEGVGILQGGRVTANAVQAVNATETAGNATQFSDEAAEALSHVPSTTIHDTLYNLYQSIVK
jgi:hypothetical protein